jgi:hypothetical protein
VDLRFELEYRVAGQPCREVLAGCCCARLEDAQPVRAFRFEKGLGSFAGWWYFATTGALSGSSPGWSATI